MNGRSGRPSRNTAQDLQSQVGFYLLPPDQENQRGSKSKKKGSRRGGQGSNNRRWASQNHLGEIHKPFGQ